jgi:hypothetical protein
VSEWTPLYPGQKEPVWTWWDRGDSELGLTGFLTRAERDRFSSGGKGPFKRIVTEDGHTVSQTATWREIFVLGVEPK